MTPYSTSSDARDNCLGSAGVSTKEAPVLLCSFDPKSNRNRGCLGYSKERSGGLLTIFSLLGHTGKGQKVR